MRDVVTQTGERGSVFKAIGAAVLLAVGVLWSRCPPWGAMWVVALGLYGIAKWLTWRSMRSLDAPALHATAYLVGWPGLDAREFLRPRVRPPRPSIAEWVFAAAKLLMGLLLLQLAIRTASVGDDLVAGWLGLGAIAFVLHFGSFHLLSCLWRHYGFGAVPVMDWPILAVSLSQFWGRRWNRPVNDGTYQIVFRPLARTFGVQSSALVAFLFSGLIHELLVTIPAQASWGSPTAYFLIQGVALQVERSRQARRWGLGRGWKGWLFTALVVGFPIGLLFPPTFMVEVIMPFLDRLGAK